MCTAWFLTNNKNDSSEKPEVKKASDHSGVCTSSEIHCHHVDRWGNENYTYDSLIIMYIWDWSMDSLN